jgi:predicted TIM-barrel fold metal-dependent hydrolase
VLFEQLLPASDPIVARQWAGELSNNDPFAWLRAHDIYMDCAWLDGGALQTAVDLLGADRLLFGTDGSAHAGSIPFFRGQLEALKLPPADAEAIRSSNAVRAFGLGGATR